MREGRQDGKQEAKLPSRDPIHGHDNLIVTSHNVYYVKYWLWISRCGLRLAAVAPDSKRDKT